MSRQEPDFQATYRLAAGGPKRLLVEQAGKDEPVVVYTETEDPEGRRHWRRETHDERTAQLLGLIVVGVYEREK